MFYKYRKLASLRGEAARTIALYLAAGYAPTDKVFQQHRNQAAMLLHKRQEWEQENAHILPYIGSRLHEYSEYLAVFDEFLNQEY